MYLWCFTCLSSLIPCPLDLPVMLEWTQRNFLIAVSMMFDLFEYNMIFTILEKIIVNIIYFFTLSLTFLFNITYFSDSFYKVQRVNLFKVDNLDTTEKLIIDGFSLVSLVLIFSKSHSLILFFYYWHPCDKINGYTQYRCIKSLPDMYLLKVTNRNTRIRSEICSKLTIKTPERRRRRSDVFIAKIANLEHISHLVLMFLLLTLNM